MFFASKILDLNTWLLDLATTILDQDTWIPPVHVAAYLGSVQLGRLGCKDGGSGGPQRGGREGGKSRQITGLARILNRVMALMIGSITLQPPDHKTSADQTADIDQM